MAVTFGTSEFNSQVWYYDSTAETYTYRTYCNNQDLFPDTAVAGDYILFGFGTGTNDCQFSPWYLKMNLSTALAASSIEIVWEVPITQVLGPWGEIQVADSTLNFTQTGEKKIALGWREDAWVLRSGEQPPSGYAAVRYVRARIVSVSGLTEGGHHSANNVLFAKEGIYTDGWSSETPGTFADIYTAELAGTRNLHFPVLCTTGLKPINPKPCEQGAIKITSILSGTSAGAGDTIDITGTDSEENSVSESIDVSGGDGTYESSYSYKTISNVDCTGWNDGTIEITQGRWGGFGADKDQKVFIFYMPLTIGNNTPTTYFADSGKTLIYVHGYAVSAGQTFLRINGYTEFQLGELVDEDTKQVANGCSVHYQDTKVGYAPLVTHMTTPATSKIYLYACDFKADIGQCRIQANQHEFRVWGCNLTKNVGIMSSSNIDVARTNVQGATDAAFTLSSTSGDVVLSDCYLSGTVRGVYQIGSNKQVRDLVLRGFAQAFRQNFNAYLVNIDSDTWVGYIASALPTVYRQYSLNMKVVDGGGTGVSSASVVMVDVNNNEVFSLTTDANGDIDEQDVTYKTYTASGGGEKVADIITDFSPHTITVSKSGYQTKTMKLTMDRKREQVVVLEKVLDYNLSRKARVFSQ